MTHDLKTEYRWYLENKPELLEQHAGQVLVIQNGTVLGVYASEPEAVQETVKEHELGTFLVQPCQAEEELQIFHSRVVFV